MSQVGWHIPHRALSQQKKKDRHQMMTLIEQTETARNKWQSERIGWGDLNHAGSKEVSLELRCDELTQVEQKEWAAEGGR